MDRRVCLLLTATACLLLDSTRAANSTDGVMGRAAQNVEEWTPCPVPPRAFDSESTSRPFGTIAGPSFDVPENDDRPYWRRNLFKRFLGDQKFLVTSWWPAESRRIGFTAPLVLAVAGASGSTDPQGGVDLRWQRSIEGWTVGRRHDVAEGLTKLGETEAGIALLGSVYLVSRWTGSTRTQRAASLSAEALANAGLHTMLFKRLARRTRPASGGSGEFFVSRPEDGQEASSFPSGHASGAFAVATVFAWEFRDRRWVPWVAYGTAGLIALSRVSLGRHFPSDVLAGAVLGHSMGRMVVHRNGGADDPRPWTRLQPLVDPGNDGVGIAYRHSW